MPKEIIGENMKQVIDACDIKATMTAKVKYYYWDLEVWEMLDEEYIDFASFCQKLSDEYWYEKFDGAWWRHAEGSNLGMPNYTFTINDVKIRGWKDDKDMADICDDCKKDYEDCEDELNWPNCINECSWLKFDFLNEYICDSVGASTEKNVAAVVTDLAKYNNMTIAELLKKTCKAWEQNL